MLRHLLCTALLIGFIIPTHLVPAQSSIIYKSEANDMADISLELKASGGFVLTFTDLETDKKLVRKGKWSKENKRYTLKFRRWKTPDLVALFQTDKKSAKIIDSRTCSFPSRKKGLYLWGVYCKRE